MAQAEPPPEGSFVARLAVGPSASLDEIDRIAAGLYTLASMLVGEGEECVRLVEEAVACADLSSSSDAAHATKRSQTALLKAAISLLAERNPTSVASPVGLEHASTCIGDDDLDAVGREELSRMFADRGRLRAWLAGLPDPLRAIFILRAVGGLASAEAASLLASCGGPAAAGWTAESVREVFRQALCSLASQLIHATGVR